MLGSDNEMKKIAFLLLAVALVSACQKVHKEMRLSMSTTLSLTIVGSRPDWTDVFTFAGARAALYNHRMPNGPLWILNRDGRSEIPDRLVEVLQTGLEIADRSNGAFDPTILPLTRTWSFDTGGRLPSEKEVTTAGEKVDFRALQLEGDWATLPSGFGLDLGGIAKGAVVDDLADFLEEKGYSRFLIDAGGDILVSSEKSKDVPWVIAIRNPRRSQLIGTVTLGSKNQRTAIVTSGDYERFFNEEGRRYHHLLDPRTGYPAEELVSVTVIATTCARADALATAAFVLGREGLPFLEALPGTEGLLIEEKDGDLIPLATSGFPMENIHF